MWVSWFSLNIPTKITTGASSLTSGFDATGADRGPGTGSLGTRWRWPSTGIEWGHTYTHLHTYTQIYIYTHTRPTCASHDSTCAYIGQTTHTKPTWPWKIEWLQLFGCRAHLRSAAGTSQVIDSWHSTRTYGWLNFGPPEMNKAPIYIYNTHIYIYSIYTYISTYVYIYIHKYATKYTDMFCEPQQWIIQW